LVVIDYLQLLDQRRTNPSLQAQVEALGDFAREKRLTVVLISQIHKRFEDASNALPTREDVRLPNPLDLDLFDELWFLHHGQLARETALSSR
jgi:replicative DNA helicase